MSEQELKVKAVKFDGIEGAGLSPEERAAARAMNVVMKTVEDPADAIAALHMAMINMLVQNAKNWHGLKAMERALRARQRDAIPNIWDGFQQLGGREGQDGHRPELPTTVDEVRQRHPTADIADGDIDGLKISVQGNELAQAYAIDALDELRDNLDAIEQVSAATTIMGNIIALTSPTLEDALSNMEGVFSAAKAELIRAWPEFEADKKKRKDAEDE